ncbi:MAG: hypothetical protein NTU41_06940 [Chloroflexi bacterium]|nr:hypothetical protein [Chloroflexota bacterium]
MTSMDFTNSLYAQATDREGLLCGLDALIGTGRMPVTLIPFACERPPTECLRVGDRSRRFRLVWENDAVALFELTFHSSGKGKESTPMVGKFFVFQHPTFPDVYVGSTIERPDFVRRALLPFFEQQRSRIYLTFIRHHDLRTILKSFRDGHGFTDLRVARASCVSRFSAERQEEKIISSVSWFHLPLEQAFEYAQQQNGWFKSLTFESMKESASLAEVAIQRNGIVRTDGQFLSVYRGIVLPVCQLIKENLALFAKRGRRDNPHLSVRPLAIDFGNNQLESREERGRFVDAMRKLHDASVSMVHDNPYIAMSVVDYVDGSTFDLWVLSANELVIVPQLKSTALALRRLISHVFDNYGEGHIRDFEVASQ